MRRGVLLPLLVYAVQLPITTAYAAGLLPVHPIVIFLPLVGLLNGHVERRGPGALGVTVVQPIRSLLFALAFALLAFIGHLMVLRVYHAPPYAPPLNGATIGSLTTDFVVDVFIIALWEEIVNRGYIQTRLQKAWGFWGVVVASLLFASLHVPSALLDHGTAQMAFCRVVQTGLSGSLLGYLFWWTGSVFPTIALHGLSNFLSLSVVQHLGGVTAGRPPTVQMPYELLWLLAQVGLVTTACRLAFGNRRPSP